MTKGQLAKAVGISVVLWLLIILAVVALSGQQQKAKEFQPIKLTDQEAKLVDLLREKWQDKTKQADAKRIEYERAIIEREVASAEAGTELNRLLQSKGGSFDNYTYDWESKTFTPKKK